MYPTAANSVSLGLTLNFRKLLICFAAAISLFAMWCSVKARANTTHAPKASTSKGAPVPGAEVSPYNAAASVNMAFWLFFEVWLANTLVNSLVSAENVSDDVKGFAPTDLSISSLQSSSRFSSISLQRTEPSLRAWSRLRL